MPDRPDPDAVRMLAVIERQLRRRVAGPGVTVGELEEYIASFSYADARATDALRLWLDVRRELRATIADEAQTQPGPTAPQESE